MVFLIFIVYSFFLTDEMILNKADGNIAHLNLYCQDGQALQLSAAMLWTFKIQRLPQLAFWVVSRERVDVSLSLQTFSGPQSTFIVTHSQLKASPGLLSTAAWFFFCLSSQTLSKMLDIFHNHRWCQGIFFYTEAWWNMWLWTTWANWASFESFRLFE